MMNSLNTNDEFIKYSVLFLAMGASIIHLATYPTHEALSTAYSLVGRLVLHSFMAYVYFSNLLCR